MVAWSVQMNRRRWKWKDVPFTLGTIVCRFRAQAPLLLCVSWFDIATGMADRSMEFLVERVLTVHWLQI